MRESRLEPGCHIGTRPSLGEHEIGELGLAGHPGRQRSPERDARAAALAAADGQGDPGGAERRRPGLDRVGSRHVLGVGIVPEDDPPALAGLADWPRGAVVHVC